MTTAWQPDFCINGQCLIIGSAIPNVITLCNRHQNIKDLFGLTYLQIYRVILFSSRRRSRAQRELAEELGREDHHMPMYRPAEVIRLNALGLWPPPTPYIRVELDGGFRLVTGLAGAALTAVQTRIANALAAEESESGVTGITVE